MAIASRGGRDNWMKVIDVMTKDPLTITAFDTVGQAEEIMHAHGIRQLPVVNRTQLIGIVTDRDIRSFLSSSLFAGPESRDKAYNTPVRDIMTAAPITLSPDDDLQDAVELLLEEKVGGVPVVDEEEGLIGIVTYVDLLRCFLNRLQEE